MDTNNLKPFYEVRLNQVTLGRFETLVKARNYAKKEIADGMYGEYLDIYQLNEIMIQSIKK